jgi:hypothetical protein
MTVNEAWDLALTTYRIYRKACDLHASHATVDRALNRHWAAYERWAAIQFGFPASLVQKMARLAA